MSEFEKTYQIDPIREHDQDREKHSSIELSDEIVRAKFIYRQPIETDIPEELKKKYDLAMKICEHTKLINLGDKNEQEKSKGLKKKSIKNNCKSNKTTVARLQKKL